MTTQSSSASAIPSRLVGLSFARVNAGATPFLMAIREESDLPALSRQEHGWLCDPATGFGVAGILLVRQTGALWELEVTGPDGADAPELHVDAVLALGAHLEHAGLAELANCGVDVHVRAGGQYRLSTNQAGYVVDGARWDFVDAGAAQRQAFDSTVDTQGLDVPRPGLSMEVGGRHAVVALASMNELTELQLSGEPPRVEPEPRSRVCVSYVMPGEPLVEDDVAAVSMRCHSGISRASHGHNVGPWSMLENERESSADAAISAAVAVQRWAGAGGASLAKAWAITQPGALFGVWLGADQRAKITGSAHVAGTVTVG